uniref:Uncharacterized protein n=1 Tax=Branchiostoma floridae TaxID=7739 RepID=C3YC74_BRAFL|eukprot:XP_002606096.1 hypothetical protein BRAFLDRAFT_88006 [Branchiostoma floridae]
MVTWAQQVLFIFICVILVSFPSTCSADDNNAPLPYGDLFTKEEGHFFGPDFIVAYNSIDADECARRCLQGYGSYDSVNPPCLSFNHRPAGSPEGGSARCWLHSSNADTAVLSSEWDNWPHRNYYQRKVAYNDIDAEECARRCLKGYGSYDGVNPPCLSFNHRPAGSPEGDSARCWLRSSNKDKAASPGSEWNKWPHRNYYQKKVDGQWSEWGPWSDCSVGCGQGSNVRRRNCSDPAPRNGGWRCAGKPVEIKECTQNKKCSSGKDAKEWMNIWSPWGQCQGDPYCSIGTRQRQMTCPSGIEGCPRRTEAGNGVVATSEEFCTLPPCHGFQGKVSDLWINYQQFSLNLRFKTLSGDWIPVEEVLSINKTTVNGNWAAWSSWSDCTATCGDGVRTRDRTCTDPAPYGDGTECDGQGTEVEHCSIPPCIETDGSTRIFNKNSYLRYPSPTHPSHVWRAFVRFFPYTGDGLLLWTENDVDNENVTKIELGLKEGLIVLKAIIGKEEVDVFWEKPKSRNRVCTNPAPSHGGQVCTGPDREEKACEMTRCPDNDVEQPWQWQSWEIWQPCDRTCDMGYRQRRRGCMVNPNVEQANSDGNLNCVGRRMEIMECHVAECAVNGNWAAWSSWSDCTATCGDGVRTRDRTCTDPAPYGDGTECDGQGTEVEHCSIPPCIETDGSTRIFNKNSYLRYPSPTHPSHVWRAFVRFFPYTGDGLLLWTENDVDNENVTKIELGLKEGLIVLKAIIGKEEVDVFWEKPKVRFQGKVSDLWINYQQFSLNLRFKTLSGDWIPVEGYKSINKTTDPLAASRIFFGREYAVIPITPPRHAQGSFTISMVLMPSKEEGLLFYNKGKEDGTFIILFLKDNRFDIKLGFGSGSRSRTLGEVVTPDRWMHLQLTIINGGNLEMRINSGPANKMFADEMQYQPGPSLLIGGVTDALWKDLASSRHSKEYRLVQEQRGFMGVIYSVKVYGQEFKMTDVALQKRGLLIDSATTSKAAPVPLSYEDLFTKEEGHFFGDRSDFIVAYNDIDAEECARRCLKGYGSYDGVNPPCLSFNHRPALFGRSREGNSARCWLRSSNKDMASSPGSEWDKWPHRNYYQKKGRRYKEMVTSKGSSLKLRCDYSFITRGKNHPKPHVIWLKEDRRQLEGTFVNITNGEPNNKHVSMLHLRDLHSSMTGSYSCLVEYGGRSVVTNAFGILVYSPPQIPETTSPAVLALGIILPVLLVICICCVARTRRYQERFPVLGNNQMVRSIKAGMEDIKAGIVDIKAGMVDIKAGMVDTKAVVEDPIDGIILKIKTKAASAWQGNSGFIQLHRKFGAKIQPDLYQDQIDGATEDEERIKEPPDHDTV